MMLIVVELINDARPEIIGTTFKAITLVRTVRKGQTKFLAWG